MVFVPGSSLPARTVQGVLIVSFPRRAWERGKISPCTSRRFTAKASIKKGQLVRDTYRFKLAKNNELTKQHCFTTLSNEIIVNVDGNFFIVVFEAKYAVRTPDQLSLLCSPSSTILDADKVTELTLSPAGTTSPPFP